MTLSSLASQERIMVIGKSASQLRFSPGTCFVYSKHRVMKVDPLLARYSNNRGPMKVNIKSKSRIHETKANIFAALDLDDAPVLHAKSGLVFHIARILKQRKLTKAKAAAILGME